MLRLLLPSFVILPIGQSGVDIAMLAPFRPTAQQDDKCLAILAEVDPVTGSVVELVLENSGADAFDVREIPQRDPGQRGCYLRGSHGIQAIEPCRVWAVTFGIEIFSNVDHRL
jgi:hypothetical protein